MLNSHLNILMTHIDNDIEVPTIKHIFVENNKKPKTEDTENKYTYNLRRQRK